MRIRSRNDVIAQCRRDMPSFCRMIGFKDRTALAPHQLEWQERIQDRMVRAMEQNAKRKRLCILGPSEHGKTFSINVPAVLWPLARYWQNIHMREWTHGRNLRIGILGSTEKKAQRIGNVIDRIFRQRRDLLAEFGLQQGSVWNADEKFLVRDSEQDVSPSMTFFGPTSEIQGDRFDILLMIDFFTVKNQDTPEKREKLKNYLDESVFNRMEPWGFILADGHLVDEEDTYYDWEQNEDDWEVGTYRAIVKEPTATVPAEVLWAERWPFEKLDQIRRSRPRVFSLMYQNIRTPKESGLVRASFDACLDRTRPLLTHMLPEQRIMYDVIRLDIDPAFTVKRRSAYSHCWVWGISYEPDPKDPTKAGAIARQDLLTGWRLKLHPQQLKVKIASTFTSFLPDYAFIEANVAQILLTENVREILGIFASRVHPVYTHANTPEDSPDHGVGACIELINAGKTSFPYLGEGARVLIENLWLEISRWPRKPNDAIMCWVIGENGLRTKGRYARKSYILDTGMIEQVVQKVYPEYQQLSLRQQLENYQKGQLDDRNRRL